MSNGSDTPGPSNLRENENMQDATSSGISTGSQTNLQEAPSLENLQMRLRHAFFMQAVQVPMRKVPEQIISFEETMEILKKPPPEVELNIHDEMRHSETDCCNDEECVVALCNTMRRYISHFMICKDLKGDCLACKQVFELCTAHGKICKVEPEFAMPFCNNFKKYALDPKYYENLFANQNTALPKEQYYSLYLKIFLRNNLNTP